MQKKRKLLKKAKKAYKKADREYAEAHEPIKKRNKIKKVMEEFEDRELHSGSEKGPIVTNKKQAIAIALSEARKKKKRK